MHLLSSLVLSTRSGEQKLQGNNTRLCGLQRRGAAARSVVVQCGSGRRVEGIRCRWRGERSGIRCRCRCQGSSISRGGPGYLGPRRWWRRRAEVLPLLLPFPRPLFPLSLASEGRAEGPKRRHRATSSPLKSDAMALREGLAAMRGEEKALVMLCCSVFMFDNCSPSSPFLFRTISNPFPAAVFAFSASWSTDDWILAGDRGGPFRESEIDASLFPSLRNIGNDMAARVNGTFLHSFQGFSS